MTPNSESLKQSLLETLDEPAQVGQMADRAAYSQPQFYRRVKQEIGQTPMSARRRLLLERAAYRLTRTSQSITEVAFDAAFESLEGFSRAFRRAFGLSPSAYRKRRPEEYRIDLSENLHYAPNSEPIRRGDTNMKIPQLLAGHHVWMMGRYLDSMHELSDEQLDTVLPSPEPYPWCDRDVTFRQMTSRACAFAAPWMHAINGIESDYRPETMDAMRACLPINLAGFQDIANAVERDNSYDLTFVDAVCDPPEVFSYGGVIAHMLTNSAYRRYAIFQEFMRLGLPMPDKQDPINFAGR